MGKQRIIGQIMPKMVVLPPVVVNVSNPIENVATEDVEEGFNLSLAEDAQNEIVSDSVLKVGVLRSKLERIEKERRFGDFDNHEGSK
jgi:hypothetical protein